MVHLLNTTQTRKVEPSEREEKGVVDLIAHITYYPRSSTFKAVHFKHECWSCLADTSMLVTVLDTMNRRGLYVTAQRWLLLGRLYVFPNNFFHLVVNSRLQLYDTCIGADSLCAAFSAAPVWLLDSSTFRQMLNNVRIPTECKLRKLEEMYADERQLVDHV